MDQQGRQRVTLKHVANEAGVSVAIASRVLANYGSYSEKSQIAVVAAAAKLNYRTNGVARSLRLQRTKTIGVLVSQISSYHWTTFVQGVEESARQAGYGVILANTGDDAKRELTYLQDLRERGMDGIIASPLDPNIKSFKQVADSGFPLVTVNVNTQSTKGTVVRSDDRRAGADAVAYLHSLGHRRIGLVAGDQAIESGRVRLESYKLGLRENGLAIDESLITYGNYRHDEAYAAASDLIKRDAPPTALLVCNESMTGAVLQCMHEHSIKIPDDMSLVGFDDPDWASFYMPAITTLREERYYMGKLACDALLTTVEQTQMSRAPAPIALRTQLVVRASCAPPRVSGLTIRNVVPTASKPETADLVPPRYGS
ncbi:LacI family DNA-binding transcriptional regulator [Pararhizobium sp. IMCC21322]|uniref:LacI family DNA-binding transcriptional regulator n=1 Tax=Pararhizobium sp. IMCC21322 TaxID=3067903 RepID=UPI00274124BC|nr:LacI family DNA-binding transcriptional regulator [Pararhizobium sp. IMCC21322]